MIRKTVLFLCRDEITYQYAYMYKYAIEKFDVIYVAYAEKDLRVLETFGIPNIINYRELSNKLFDTLRVTPELLEEIDSSIIKNSDGRFNLNQAIQSDRGFNLLTYPESLKSAAVHYTIWKEIFAKNHVDYLFHEICSLYFNHIAALLCKGQNGRFLWYCFAIQEGDSPAYAILEHDDYSCYTFDYNYNFYKQNPDKIDFNRCKKYLEKFRGTNSIVAPEKVQKKQTFKFRYLKYRRLVGKVVKNRKLDKLKENVEYFLSQYDYYGEKVRNLRDYKKYKIRFNEPNPDDKYYYYSFHLEPEAVLLYLSDGIYTNQIKLIQNIAAALPAGTYLYVKDHPHEMAYREAVDYYRLNQIPNVKLIRSTIAGKTLAKDAIGVFSINGTAGVEAMLFGKQVFNFGKVFYSSAERQNYVHNIRDLRPLLYSLRDVRYDQDETFYAFVNAYLETIKEGYINFFTNASFKCNVDHQYNARKMVDDLYNYSLKF